MAVFQRKPDRKEGKSADAEPESADGGGLLGSLKKRSGGLMDRVAGSVKEAARSNLLKQAVEARERGNLAASFHLAKEEFGNQPDDLEVAGFYWDVAVSYERPAEALTAVALLIRKNVIGAHELATQYWVELDTLVPGALIDPSTLARVVPHLAKQVDEDETVEDPPVKDGAEEDPDVVMARQAREARKSALRSAFRAIVDERNRDALTAGLAMHVAELARDLDPPSALAAAHHALGCEDVHQTKRDRLQALIADLDSDAPVPAAPAPVAEVEPPAPESSAAAEEDCADEDLPVPIEAADTSDTSETEEHPARNHPLREDAPPRGGLSDDEVAKLQQRLPPSRKVAVPAGTPTEGAEPLIADAADEPIEPESDSASGPGAKADLEIDILSESAPELEVDDLEVSNPDLEVDVDVLAESFPELQVEDSPSAPEVSPEPDVDEAAVLEAIEPEIEIEADVEVAEEPAVASAGADRSETMDVLAALDPEPDEVSVEPDLSEIGEAELPLDPLEATPADDPQPAPIPIDPSVEAPIFPDLKRMPAQPTGLEDTALLIEVAGSRRARIELDQVHAIAVGEVAGLADSPVVVIDLLMDVRDADGAPLRLVRLRGDQFDPLLLMPEESDAGAALQSLLSTLMERTRAIPLPDPEAALGLIVPRFESIDEYEQQVLQVRR